MADPGGLELNDVVVSEVDEGHLLLIVTTLPWDRWSLLSRGHDWSVHYASGTWQSLVPC